VSAAAGSGGRGWPVRAAMWLCGGAVVCAVFFRIVYLANPARIDISEHPVFIADEAILGLMARHILAGARPIFYYGQAYMGATEAYLAAPLFAAFGDSLTTLRVVPVLSTFVSIGLVAAIAVAVYGRMVALLAAALTALPSLFVFEWGFKARGGYAEFVALTLAMVLLLLRLLDRRRLATFVLLGLTLGVTLWTMQLVVGFAPVIAAVLVLWVRPRAVEWTALAAATLLGAAPLIYANVVDPLCTVRALANEVHSAARVHARAGDTDAEDKAYRSVPFFELVGAQPRRDGRWSVPGAAAAALLIGGALAGIGRALRRWYRGARTGRAEVVIAAFALVSFGLGASGFSSGQPVGRYQLPLYPLAALLAVAACEAWSRSLAPLAAAGVLLVNGIEIASPPPVEARTAPAAVAAALEAHDLQLGYGSGFMDDIVLAGHEHVVIVPLERARYAPYEQRLRDPDRLFYVFRDDQRNKPAHRVFLAYLDHAGIRYQQFAVGEYTVLFDLQPAGQPNLAALAEIRRQIRAEKGLGAS
jgi:hypothetical protein